MQQIYNANYQFAVPPPLPTADRRGRRRLRAAVVGRRRRARRRSGDRRVRLRGLPHLPLHRSRVPRPAGDHDRHRHAVRSATAGRSRSSTWSTASAATPSRTVEGVAYWLGDDTGITHTWTDTTVTNGQEYYYAVTAYDFGSETADSHLLSVGERDRGVAHAARRLDPAAERGARCGPNPRCRAMCRGRRRGREHVAGRGVGTGRRSRS